MKRIAIIGSGSFLAKNFIQHCIDERKDYDFELYDFVTRYDYPQYPFMQINFNDLQSVKQISFCVDFIMVFIGKTGTTIGFEKYQQFIEVNEVMLLNILYAYVEAKSKALIVYPSSRLVFKSNEKEKVSECSPRECKSIYAITKLAAEEYLRLYKEVYGIHYVILRICTPIGSLLEEYGNYGTFEIFKNQALGKKEITVFGDGNQRKTFTSIGDICRAFTLLIDKGKPEYNDYNLGGQELRLLDIAKSIANEYSAEVKHIPWPDVYRMVDGGSVVFDSTRFDKEFLMVYEKLLDGT